MVPSQPDPAAGPAPDPGRAGYTRTRIRERIQDTCREAQSPFLPSLRALASAYRVGRRDITAAVADLIAAGALVRLGRNRIAIAGRALPAPPPAASRDRTGEVLARLREALAAGRYRGGEPFPKLLGLAAEMGAAPATVLKALARLAREGYAHKRGRSWYAGRAGGAPRPPGRAGTLILFLPRTHAWHNFGQSPRYRGFRSQFASEAQLRGYRILPVSPQPGFAGGLRLEGKAHFRRLTQGLGTEWAGTLCLGRRGEYRDFAGWLHFLLAAGRPLVWFDDLDQGHPPLPPATQRLLTARAREGTYTRCFPTTDPGLELALDHLYRHGHRLAGFPWVGDEPWIPLRLESLRELASRSFPGMEILASRARPPDQQPATPASLARHWASLLRRGDTLTAALLKQALAGLPAALRGPDPGATLLALARDRVQPNGIPRTFPEIDFVFFPFAEALEPLLRARVTALILPNDFQAGYFADSLGKAGYRIPGDLSLVSFDNYSQGPHALATDTVDFDLGRLGYCAFHALLRDIPLGRDRRGDLPARPFLVYQGTVGMPKSGRWAVSAPVPGASAQGETA